MSIAYLGLGSNLNAAANIYMAVAELNVLFPNLSLSPIYQSTAVGFEGDDFINLVASIDTTLEPIPLKHLLNEIEDRHGRRRDVPKFSDRSLDIDILLYDDLVLNHEELVLPRDEVSKFAHVLKPLADLVPDMIYPDSDSTLLSLWQNFPQDKVALRAITIPLPV